MILHDATKIMINSIGADKVLHRGDLIWPTEEPVEKAHILGITTINGTTYTSGQTYNIWEHNTSQPIWIKHDGELVNPRIEITGISASLFAAEHIDGDMFKISDTDWYNNNYTRNAVLNIYADNVDDVYTVKISKQIEVGGNNFIYNEHACVASVEFISEDGVDTTREFYATLDRVYPLYSDTSIMPCRNEGLNAYGKFLTEVTNGYVVNEEVSWYGNIEVSDTIGDIRYNDDNAMEIYKASTEFTNSFVSYRIGPNTTGHNRYFGIFVYPSTVTQSPVYLFLIQPSK